MMVYICTKFHENILERYQSYGADTKSYWTDGGHDIIRPVFDGRIKTGVSVEIISICYVTENDVEPR